jgi:hypothetical protein
MTKIKTRCRHNATGYRFSVQDLGSRRQLRWMVTLRRNGGLIHQTKCMNNPESYGRAVMACFARAETCRRLGTYCYAQVQIALASQAYARQREANDERIRAMAKS